MSVRSLLGHTRRFFAKVETDENGCWVWTGAATKGYGQFKLGGRQYAAHRLSYEAHVGPIPEGLVIDHLCRNTLCVNHEHMEPVTNAENIRRGLVGENQRSKTHCPQGHPYDEENTYRVAGGRKCRICKRETHRRWWARRSAA